MISPETNIKNIDYSPIVNFKDFPSEICLRVYEYLLLDDMFSIRQANQYWNSLAKHTTASDIVLKRAQKLNLSAVTQQNFRQTVSNCLKAHKMLPQLSLPQKQLTLGRGTIKNIQFLGNGKRVFEDGYSVFIGDKKIEIISSTSQSRPIEALKVINNRVIVGTYDEIWSINPDDIENKVKLSGSYGCRDIQLCTQTNMLVCNTFSNYFIVKKFGDDSSFVRHDRLTSLLLVDNQDARCFLGKMGGILAFNLKSGAKDDHYLFSIKKLTHRWVKGLTQVSDYLIIISANHEDYKSFTLSAMNKKLPLKDIQICSFKDLYFIDIQALQPQDKTFVLLNYNDSSTMLTVWNEKLEAPLKELTLWSSPPETPKNVTIGSLIHQFICKSHTLYIVPNTQRLIVSNLKSLKVVNTQTMQVVANYPLSTDFPLFKKISSMRFDIQKNQLHVAGDMHKKINQAQSQLVVLSSKDSLEKQGKLDSKL